MPHLVYNNNSFLKMGDDFIALQPRAMGGLQKQALINGGSFALSSKGLFFNEIKPLLLFQFAAAGFQPFLS